MDPAETRIKSVQSALYERVGFIPQEPIGWLYAARGLFKQKEYHFVIEALSHCIRNEKTKKEAQHLLSFCLLHTGQTAAATSAFYRSVKIGNETDWQSLVELLLENPTMRFGVAEETSQ
eukprot:GILJ01003643.1.p1 GENE.GILJ01003643.1~~GILJ01003643.1.p1  ORF type:complete len:119 (-),score=18.36 GILJ01003643.1:181-537(-)